MRGVLRPSRDLRVAVTRSDPPRACGRLPCTHAARGFGGGLSLRGPRRRSGRDGLSELRSDGLSAQAETGRPDGDVDPLAGERDRRAAVLERDAAAAALGARRLPPAVVRPRTSRDVVRGIAVSDRRGVDPDPHARTASSLRAGAARDALRTPRGRSAGQTPKWRHCSACRAVRFEQPDPEPAHGRARPR